MERFGLTYGPGDKVMQVTNNYERDVFNGDLGVVSGIDLDEGSCPSRSTAARWSMASANWMSWFWPTPRPSTRHKVQSIRRW